MSPDTRVNKTVRTGGGRLWWAAPGYVVQSLGNNGVPSGEAVSATWRPTAGPVVTPLALAWPTRTVTALSRDTITVASATGPMQGALPFGAALLYTQGAGVVPVRVVAVDGTTIRLADRLPPGLVVSAAARLQSALWWADVTDADVVGAVTRTAGAGDRPVPYSVTWDVLTPAPGSGVGNTITPQAIRTEGVLSVVRQPFGTGLTPDALARYYPEVARMAQAGGASTEAAIARTAAEMALRVRGDVREARGSYYAEDDVSGPALEMAHAAAAAAALVESVAPDRAAALVERYETLYRQGLAAAWLDFNRDGVVDADEVPGAPGLTTSAQRFPVVSLGNSPITWEPGQPR